MLSRKKVEYVDKDTNRRVVVAVGIIYPFKNDFKCSKDSVFLPSITPENVDNNVSLNLIVC